MNCKQCGAPIQIGPDRSLFRCEYCGSFDIPEPDKDGVALLDEVSPLNCPVCMTPLVTAVVEGIHILSCPTCRGNLIDQVKLHYTLRLAAPIDTTAEDELHPANKSELKRKLSCPSCKKTMETYPYGGSGNIIIQGCDRCQWIWLDFGELPRIIHSYTPPHKHNDE